MASVWRSRRRDGTLRKRWHYYFLDYLGKRCYGTGTRSRTQTRKLAEKLEEHHREIRLGLRPKPKRHDRNTTEVITEYLAWGAVSGGRGGRPWSPTHQRNKSARLQWWVDRLALKIMHDLAGSLAAVEAQLRALREKGKSEKTTLDYADALFSFCVWAVRRDYLEVNPLKDIKRSGATTSERRRALTLSEVRALLSAAPPDRAIVYETAILTGLRANELASLKAVHLDLESGGLLLEAAWTKNRRDGFMPVPEALLKRLAAPVKGKSDETPLLRVPSHTARSLDMDATKAGIQKVTKDGKLDFHSLRVTFTTLVVEAGANVKEAQELSRHATPDMTMNRYARTRNERLAALTEAVGNLVGAPMVDHETSEAPMEDKTNG